jgi:hypothetical protein
MGFDAKALGGAAPARNRIVGKYVLLPIEPASGDRAMTRDEIAAELMRLHTHLRASADAPTKFAIRRRIDALVREAATLSEAGASKSTEGAEPTPPDARDAGKVR